MADFVLELNSWRTQNNIKVDELDTHYIATEPKKKFYHKANYIPEDIKNNKGIIQWTGRCTDGVIRTYRRINTLRGSKWMEIKVQTDKIDNKKVKALEILELLKQLEG